MYAGLATRCTLDEAHLVEQVRDPLVGRQLDRYHVEERLGIGGMGCVYRARHSVIDRAYAIKVLFGDFANNDKFQARFRREATSISKIRHPNIVQVEDFGRTPQGLTFLAMELVRGQTLERVLEQEGRISAWRAGNIASQIASGLGAAHRLGFIHRDVKPSNIMLSPTPRPESVKLLDFGAVSLRTEPSDERLTAVGHIIGTPTYMAPEQSQDPGVGPTADIYALGVLLYEMLAGKPPFHGHNRAAVIVQHLTEPPPPLPPSEGLEHLVDWMLRKLPEERPQSMDEVTAELDRLGLNGRASPSAVAAAGPPIRTAPADQNDPSFYAAPTNEVLLGVEQGTLRKVYAGFESKPDHGDPHDAPADMKPTPPDGRFPALATAKNPSGDDWGVWSDEFSSLGPLPYPEMPLPGPGLSAAPDTLVVRERTKVRAPSAADSEPAVRPTTPTDEDLRRLLHTQRQSARPAIEDKASARTFTDFRFAPPGNGDASTNESTPARYSDDATAITPRTDDLDSMETPDLEDTRPPDTVLADADPVVTTTKAMVASRSPLPLPARPTVGPVAQPKRGLTYVLIVLLVLSTIVLVTLITLRPRRQPRVLPIPVIVESESPDEVIP